MKTANDKLRELITKKRLTYQDVSGILNVSYRCIQNWVAHKNSESFRPMREHFLELLQIKLKKKRKRA